MLASEENKNQQQKLLLSDIRGKKIPKDVLALISREIAEGYRMVPIRKEGDVLTVAMEDPEDARSLAAIRFLARNEDVQLEIKQAEKAYIDKVLSLYTSAESALKSVISTIKKEGDDSEERRFKKQKTTSGDVYAFSDAPVAKLVNVIIGHAISGKASDIHIEPIGEEYRVRFRVDGILHSSLTLPEEAGKAAVARIKILSNLKIDEKRKPQDGRFRTEEGEEPIDFRVSTLPVMGGEKVVLRVLDKEKGLTDLETLGLRGRNLEIFKSRIKDPFGIILMTGPTGSGKSTTLYAFLKMLNEGNTNIVTLEDPVEYYIEGLNQSQVKPEIGYTFANGLRSILRQDPNVIMVGEIRDAETAELAIHAALTGHLVFSTLHTNDAIGAIPRLIDMGIEDFLISASTRLVGAQRLVRKICPNCKEEIHMTKQLREKIWSLIKDVNAEELQKYDLSIHGPEGIHSFRGKGCDACGKTGYKSRIAIFEVLDFTEEIEEILAGGGDIEGGIRREAEKQGMIFIKQDGIIKMLLGLTTLSEVERVTEGVISASGDMNDVE